MTATRTRTLLSALAMGLVTLVSWRVSAESNRVIFPEDLDAMVHYTTVERGNVREHMLTSPQALDAIKNGKPVPDGTHVVLVDYRSGELYRYFIMQKKPGWGADYDEARRTGEWQFQWFNADKTIKVSENTARCQSCHQSQASEDFIYTGRQMRAKR